MKAVIKTPKPICCRSLVLILSTIILLIHLINPNSNSHAQSNQAYDLIAAVNQLRTSNGLPPYEINGALMAAAQSHSEYQASIGSVTHTGVGGTSSSNRAAAAGYGGGAMIYVSENIAGGMSFTIQSVVQMWQGDSLHLSTMLSSDYQDIGAGVASSGQQTYYTIDVGYIAGNPENSSTPASSTAIYSSPESSSSYSPIQASTPLADGSIIHEVKEGQALWNIAAIYDIELPELLQLNNLGSNAFIFPGDTLMIKPASITLTNTSAEETETISTSITQATEPIPTQIEKNKIAAEITEASDLTDSPSEPGQEHQNPLLDPILIIIASLVFGGTFLIILGNLFKREDKEV